MQDFGIVLGKFLAGKMKQRFDCIKGTELNYADLTQQLGEWYKQAKQSLQSDKKLKFMNAQTYRKGSRYVFTWSKYGY